MPLQTIANDFQVLILMTVRILVLLSFTPIVSNKNSPFIIRVVLAAVFAYIVKNIMQTNAFESPKTLGDFVLLLAGEAMIGAILGFYIQMVYQFINGMSEFFSTLMGLRAVQILNPLSGESSAVITQFISITVMLVFVASYGIQKVFYYAIMQSFYAVNAYDLFKIPEESLLSFIIYNFTILFERSFMIALPIFTALLIVNIGLGLFGKVAPQMNLLVLGLPLQLGFGLFFMILFFPMLIKAFEASFDNAFSMITTFLRRVAL